MLEHWIWLARRTGLSDYLRMRLVQHFSSAAEVYEAGAREFQELSWLRSDAVKSLLDKNLTEEKKILGECMEKNVGILCLEDSGYPIRLKSIFDPPMVLYVLGTLPDVDENPVIGIVGTRHPSAYGSAAAWRMGYGIASGGGIVVSGMAMGVDGTAMNGALAAGAPVIGVLGCGIDEIYPKSNRELFADTRRQGCILSEYPPGTPGARWTFPRRNRIISGLSRGVVVVEAPEKSGSLITVQHALEQGRDVFALPGNVDLPGFQGSNRLIREGAAAVSCGWDVLETYAGQYPGAIRRPEKPESPQPAALVAEKRRVPRAKTSPADKKDIDKRSDGEYPVPTDTLAGLSPEEQTIVRCLMGGEQPVDAVIADSGMSAAKVLALMTVLEIKGKIIRLPGKRAALKSQQ